MPIFRTRLGDRRADGCRDFNKQSKGSRISGDHQNSPTSAPALRDDGSMSKASTSSSTCRIRPSHSRSATSCAKEQSRDRFGRRHGAADRCEVLAEFRALTDDEDGPCVGARWLALRSQDHGSSSPPTTRSGTISKTGERRGAGKRREDHRSVRHRSALRFLLSYCRRRHRAPTSLRAGECRRRHDQQR